MPEQIVAPRRENFQSVWIMLEIFLIRPYDGDMRKILDDIRLPLLLLALLVQAFLLARLAWLTSPNRTELGHMAASLRLYETGEFDLFHVNPPLLRYLVGPSVANFVDPVTDWSDYSADLLTRSEWATGVSFVKANDFETLRQSFFVGRVVCIPLILLGSFFGYQFAKELFGELSGFLFLLLWTFSPLILGWGATICPDVAAASLGIVSLYTYWHWTKKATWLLAILSGITLGLLPLTKLTWIIALGIWPLMGIFAMAMNRKCSETELAGFSSSQRLRVVFQLVLILLLALFTINFGYKFGGSFQKLDDFTFHSKSFTNENGENRFTNTLLGKIPVPFPKHFVLGFDTQKIDFERGMSSYLLGEHANRGWWYYYIVATFFKEPVGFLVLALLATFLFCFKNYRADWQDELSLVVPMLTLFFAVSSQAGFSLHSRYTIPFLPLWYIWVSRVGMITKIAGVNKVLQYSVVAVVVLPLFLGIASSLHEYPHSMSYINELGRDRKPPVLLGSNLDWGQDLYELKEYLDEHPEAKPLHIAMSHLFPLETLGIKSAGLPPKWKPGKEFQGTWLEQIHTGPRPGRYLLGTNDLFGASGDYDWLHEFKPTKRIGYSAYLYNITLKEANTLREKHDLPVLIEEDL